MDHAGLREKLKSSSERWWKWRFLEAVLHTHRTADEADAKLALTCFVALAQEDPDWAIAKLGAGGRVAYGLAQLFAGERIEDALEPSEPLLRAYILIARAKWPNIAGNANDWERAWSELGRCSALERDAIWESAALFAAAHADYDAYLPLAETAFARTSTPFDQASFLAKAIPVAAQHADYPTFQRWLTSYRALPPSFRRDHDECAIFNLEGLRAIDEGRLDDADKVMEEVVKLAAQLQFVSNDEISALAKRLRKLGRATELCDRFDAIKESRDWRLHL